MAGILSNIQPAERRAARIQITGATNAGTVNTNVLAFTGAPANWQVLNLGVPGTVTNPLGTTLVAPTSGSGNWINIVNSATAGSQFKYNHRGVYQVDLYAEGTAGSTVGAQIGITLDQAATIDVVATGTVTAISDTILGFQNLLGVAVLSLPLHVSVPVYITDFQAAGAQPSADGTTTRGVGVMRFIANNNGGAVIAAALIAANTRATIVYQGDLAG